MTRTLRTVAALMPLAMVACFGPDSDGSGGSDAGGDDSGAPGDWKLTHACRSDDPRDPIDVMSARVEGDSLIVEIGHGGGCAEHEYSLCYDETWQEEMPVQVPVTVLHDGHGDGCEAYLTSEVTFDLRPIADEFAVRYQQSSGTVLLLLAGGQQYTFIDAELAALEQRIDEANHCESLEECVSVQVPPCGTRFVSSTEDVAGLQDDIDAWARQAGLDQLGCDASCQCGLLTCTDGRCETTSSDCMTVPAGSSMVCL